MRRLRLHFGIEPSRPLLQNLDSLDAAKGDWRTWRCRSVVGDDDGLAHGRRIGEVTSPIDSRVECLAVEKARALDALDRMAGEEPHHLRVANGARQVLAGLGFLGFAEGARRPCETLQCVPFLP